MSKKQFPIIPTHLAIICDGNRRWARAHKLAVFKGHERAVNEVFEPLIDAAAERGIKYLTFWIFSTENWDRDKKEIDVLMNLFRSFFDRQIEELNKKGVCVNMIGNLQDFPQDIQDRIVKGMQDTKHNKKITVTLAMSYGGRDELLRAIRKLTAAVIPDLIRDPNGLVSGESKEILKQVQDDKLITKESLEKQLDTHNLPDPDFIVRTSGEQRTSGFLLWQAEYAEWYFPKWHFPEFSPAKLDECLAEFASRRRRFGK